MAKSYRPYFPEQDFLLPPSLREWLPENHLAYFVSDLIDQLDLSAIESRYEREERGYPPYHPRMMTKLLVYGYCVGVFSSRRLEKRLVEDVAFRVLAAGNEPDFRTISEFRRIHLKALEGLFEQVLRLAMKLGAMKLGGVAIDGSKVKANASKHKAMSYRRMQEEEKRLKEEVRRLLTEAEQTDKEEDKRYGRTRRGDELPAELRRREERLQRIAEAKRELEERARLEAEEKKEPQAKQCKPKPKDQHNFTDPESRIMKGGDGFVQAYNAQIAVEPVLQLIVGQAVTQQANDKKQLLPMIERVKQQSGQKVSEALVDSGYCSEENLGAAAKRKVDIYAATGKQKHNQLPPPCPRGRIPTSATLVDRMRRKLMTQSGRTIYALRKTIVEPVFGQIKQAQGFRHFLLRGYHKVQGEWALVCTSHNLLKLYRVCTA
ncbi:MAG TPA: IS1182 family transposase [Terracidiphilus sp.]|nr:IS1182 family transposase [Terracidiphilus sp.]